MSDRYEHLAEEEVAVLREIHTQGEIDCRFCDSHINFLSNLTTDDLRNGITFRCTYCGDCLVDMTGKEVEDYIRLMGWNVRSGHVQEVIDLMDNVMTDDELEEATEKLQEIKLGLKVSEGNDGFNIDEPQKTDEA